MNILEILAGLEEIPVEKGKTIAKELGSDPVPTDMGIGMEDYILDSSWVWIAKDGDKTTGFLAASPCHGTVLIWRLVIRPGARLGTMLILLRTFIRDCKNRGYIGIFSYLDPERDAEMSFMKAMRRGGGKVFDQPQFLAAASLSSLERW
jgi:hypothetical protein